MLIINANIITMEEENFEKGYLLTEGNLISQIGDMKELESIPSDALDLKGKTLLPGFIDAHCHIGMWENGLGVEGADGNEETDPITPQLDAADAVNPLDFCFEEAKNAGVTTVVTGPGSANPIAGTMLAMKTHGKRIDDMIRREKLGMKFALGENPKAVYTGKEQTPSTRMATAALIREQLNKTKRYIQDVEKSKEDEDADLPEYDIKCEAMVPLFKGEMKAFFHAHRADDIFTAIRISREFNLNPVIIHATEGHKIADILAKENVPIITGPIISDRSKPELREHTASNTAILSKAGVPAAICTDHPETPIQYLALTAGICVAKGLNRDEALKALTIYPARICGIDDITGSLKKGKRADFSVFKGDPFSVYESPEIVVIDGEIVKGSV